MRGAEIQALLVCWLIPSLLALEASCTETLGTPHHSEGGEFHAAIFSAIQSGLRNLPLPISFPSLGWGTHHVMKEYFMLPSQLWWHKSSLSLHCHCTHSPVRGEGPIFFFDLKLMSVLFIEKYNPAFLFNVQCVLLTQTEPERADTLSGCRRSGNWQVKVWLNLIMKIFNQAQNFLFHLNYYPDVPEAYPYLTWRSPDIHITFAWPWPLPKLN